MLNILKNESLNERKSSLRNLMNIKLVLIIQQILIVYLAYKFLIHDSKCIQQNCIPVKCPPEKCIAVKCISEKCTQENEERNTKKYAIKYSTIVNESVAFMQNTNSRFGPAYKHHWIDEFQKIARTHNTDKTTAHRYQNIYGTFLGPIKDENLHLLEIGLGCTMGYGPGKSIPVWREFIPKVHLSILEYDRNCSEKFRDKVEQLFIGDQSDFNLLKEVANGGPYDVIIDDGGHQAKQQINSLIGLWPALKSGGVYVIEDLYLYQVNGFYDANISTFEWINMLSFLIVNHIPTWNIKHIVPSNHSFPREVLDISRNLFSVDCFHRACVLIKN